MLVLKQTVEAVPELHAIIYWLFTVGYHFLLEPDTFDSLH